MRARAARVWPANATGRARRVWELSRNAPRSVKRRAGAKLLASSSASWRRTLRRGSSSAAAGTPRWVRVSRTAEAERSPRRAGVTVAVRAFGLAQLLTDSTSQDQSLLSDPCFVWNNGIIAVPAQQGLHLVEVCHDCALAFGARAARATRTCGRAAFAREPSAVRPTESARHGSRNSHIQNLV
jgi:hypothetical protein